MRKPAVAGAEIQHMDRAAPRPRGPGVPLEIGEALASNPPFGRVRIVPRDFGQPTVVLGTRRAVALAFTDRPVLPLKRFRGFGSRSRQESIDAVARGEPGAAPHAGHDAAAVGIDDCGFSTPRTRES